MALLGVTAVAAGTTTTRTALQHRAVDSPVRRVPAVVQSAAPPAPVTVHTIVAAPPVRLEPIEVDPIAFAPARQVRVAVPFADPVLRAPAAPARVAVVAAPVPAPVAPFVVPPVAPVPAPISTLRPVPAVTAPDSVTAAPSPLLVERPPVAVAGAVTAERPVPVPAPIAAEPVLLPDPVLLPALRPVPDESPSVPASERYAVLHDATVRHGVTPASAQAVIGGTAADADARDLRARPSAATGPASRDLTTRPPAFVGTTTAAETDAAAIRSTDPATAIQLAHALDAAGKGDTARWWGTDSRSDAAVLRLDAARAWSRHEQERAELFADVRSAFAGLHSHTGLERAAAGRFLDD